MKTLVDSAVLDLKNFDTVNMVDPLFKQTTKKFDDMNSGNLMSASLPVNSQLLIQLDSQLSHMQSISQPKSKIRKEPSSAASSLSQMFKKMAADFKFEETPRHDASGDPFLLNSTLRVPMCSQLDQYTQMQDHYINGLSSAGARPAAASHGPIDAIIEVDEEADQVPDDLGGGDVIDLDIADEQSPGAPTGHSQLSHLQQSQSLFDLQASSDSENRDSVCFLT